MNEVDYLTAKELTIESYDEFISDGFSADQAIAAAFEDSVLMMKKDKAIFISVIQNLAIISLKQKFIPDYLFNRLTSLVEELELSDIERQSYEEDKKQLALLLNENFIINKDDNYSQRINTLLS